jgi:hypothetical protein
MAITTQDQQQHSKIRCFCFPHLVGFRFFVVISDVSFSSRKSTSFSAQEKAASYQNRVTTGVTNPIKKAMQVPTIKRKKGETV